MRVLFVDNLLFEGSESRPWFDLQPHLGLMSLASMAAAAGHEAIIYDPKRALVEGGLSWSPALYEDMARALLDRDPDVVGFTALGCNFHCVVAVAAHLRALRPSLPVLLGGPHATILHREILERFACFDAIARHEAEATIAPLLAALPGRDLEGIEGVSWRDAGGSVVCNPGVPKVEELDDLPMPAYDHYPLAALGLDSIRIEAGRGCPFSCTFCSTASFFGRSYRLKSSGRMVEEMDRLNARYGFTRFKLNHDLFTVSRKKILDFCGEVASRDYLWSCSARVDCVDAELLGAMAEAGCRSIYFGIETGSEAVQASSRKRLDLALVEPILATTAALGISTTTSFIIGYPEETIEDQCDTLDMAGRLHRLPLNDSQIHLLTPEPGTALLDRHGGRLDLDDRRCGFNLPRFGGDDGALIAACPELFVTHYFYPTLVPRERNVLIAALWRQLAPLWSEAYGFLLEHWGGSLAALAEAACRWWSRTAREGAEVPADALARFAASVFGESAPIASLLRYAAACDCEPAGHHPIRAEETSDAARLAPGATLLRDIHDVARLGVSVLGMKEAERINLLVLPSLPGRALRAYTVDETTADLLTIVAAPGGDSILAFVDDDDLARLRSLHILEGGPSNPPRTRAAA